MAKRKPTDQRIAESLMREGTFTKIDISDPDNYEYCMAVMISLASYKKDKITIKIINNAVSVIIATTQVIMLASSINNLFTKYAYLLILISTIAMIVATHMCDNAIDQLCHELYDLGYEPYDQNDKQ